MKFDLKKLQNQINEMGKAYNYLEEKAELPTKFLSKIKCDGSNISIFQLCKIVNILGLSMDSAFSEDDDDEPSNIPTELKETDTLKKLEIAEYILSYHQMLEKRLMIIEPYLDYLYRSPNSGEEKVQTSGRKESIAECYSSFSEEARNIIKCFKFIDQSIIANLETFFPTRNFDQIVQIEDHLRLVLFYKFNPESLDISFSDLQVFRQAEKNVKIQFYNHLNNEKLINYFVNYLKRFDLI